MKSILILLLFILSASPLLAQSTEDWREIYERIYPADEDEENGIDESELERLDEIAANPFNINTITQEQLEELSFLSDDEINAIGYYIYRYDGMMTLNELKSIVQLSYDKQQLLRYFLYCGEKAKRDNLTLNNALKYGKHDLYYGGRIPLYERKGDVVDPEKGGYTGIPYKQQFRYAYNYANRLKIGLIGANDSGEPFFSGINSTGFDYYSFYAQLKDFRLTDSWKIANVVLGRFRAGFGMGLTLNNNFTLGKSTMMSSAGRISTGFRPHSSTTDGKYFQGIGVTFANNGTPSQAPSLRTELSVFASYRPINATVKSDTISTILNSGYHRTINELKKKNTATQSVLGADLSVRYKQFSAGLTAVYSHLNLPLMPNKSQKFRRYYAEGKDFLTTGLHYAYTSQRLTFKGELSASPASQADSESDGIALSTTNMLNYNPKYGLSFSLLHRYFSPQYTTLFGRSFAESTNLQDEHGVFGGVNYSLSSTLSAQYYIDYAHFSRPKYLVSTASNMLENVLYLAWHKNEWAVSMRGRLKNRQYDSSNKKWLVWKNNASLRLQTEYTESEKKVTGHGIHGKLTLQYAHYDKDTEKSHGFLSMFTGGMTLWEKLTADISAAYFNTDDYYSAIYAYERGMTYSMNYLQFYGEGARFSLMLKALLSKKLSVTAKCGMTKYFDRKLIGTGMEELQTSVKADIDFQIRWKF